jgi:hypothetical protein
LLSSLGAVFGGWGEEAATRLAEIEKLLKPAFGVQPNKEGRISAEASRAVAYSFFAQEHGWLLKGLEPPYESHSQELHEVAVLRKAPGMVEALVEVKRQHAGSISLGDLAAVVASIERLVLDETVGLLESAYDLNGKDMMDWISRKDLNEILQSYLLIFRQGTRANLVDAQKHQELKARAQKSGEAFLNLVDFESESVEQFGKVSSALDGRSVGVRQYSFEDAAQITRDIALRYGKWQNGECKQMSSDLQALDPDAVGSVPLEKFHQQPRHPVYGYKFTETADYLKSIGALEEKQGQEPSVLIPNYVLGPSNCIASSQYLSVCCINTCETLADEISRDVQSPTASTGQLAISTLKSTLNPALARSPRGGAASAEEELQRIAEKQQGQIQLASIEFRKWLHTAFPSTCPALPTGAKPPASSFGFLTFGPEKPGIPTIPPSHRPNNEECTRMPQYFM